MVVYTPRPPRVLVVDDCPDTRHSLGILLDLWGYEAYLAPDAPSALHAFREHEPTIALVDIGLHGDMDGWQLGRLLREQSEKLLLIAFTGYGQEQDKVRSREAGFDAHLTKPADPDELRRLLGIAARNPG
jgi:DNA-binding response OmpR family regulator